MGKRNEGGARKYKGIKTKKGNGRGCPEWWRSHGLRVLPMTSKELKNRDKFDICSQWLLRIGVVAQW